VDPGVRRDQAVAARQTGSVTGEVLPIVPCGEPILRRRAEPVDPATIGDRDVQGLIARMKATMEAAPGVGLAAPQIGEPIRLAVLQDGPERWSQLTPDQLLERDRRAVPFTVLVNPVLVAADDSESVSFYEGCLSVPGLTGVVARHRSVHVEALDEHGDPRSWTLSGWPARIVQHEVDHLDGVLYLDRAETRSLSTTDVYLQRWAHRRVLEASAALGFPGSTEEVPG
jgi:peptide deformylase